MRYRRNYTVLETQKFANKLRRKPTASEIRLHNALDKALAGTTARVESQHIVGPYIGDLYIPFAKLLIEADGTSHADNREYDEARDAYTRKRGYRTVRFTNLRIWNDLDSVVAEVVAACGKLIPAKTYKVKVTYCPPGRAKGTSNRKWAKIL